MKNILHITSGDIAGQKIARSGVLGEVFVWHDVLYDGPRSPGWPDEETLVARAQFLSEHTDGGLSEDSVFRGLKEQYEKLRTAMRYESLILWFDACLFDQSMLCHILTCLRILGYDSAELLCVDAFPEIEPYHGLGQLSPEQLASVYDQRRLVTKDQFLFSERVDRAFALQDQRTFAELSQCAEAPLPWIPAAVSRWLEEIPDLESGLGRLERLTVQAIGSGNHTPQDIFSAVSRRETPPRYWGDTTLWEKINGLANRNPPLVTIEGPADRLPQWEGPLDLTQFRIYPVEPVAKK